MSLEDYRAKRDFSHTPEPSGEPAGRREGQLFVVQKHAARRLHYDFRLELGGVLKSWAVTRGPSLDPHDKRLAVQVEDHPLEYGDFEGVIPKGEYGGGTVMLWDKGSWEPVGDPEDGLAKGVLKFRLAGEKLRGGWALVRLRDAKGGRPNWLLVKERDEAAAEGEDILAAAPLSVASHKKMEDIARAPAEVWRGMDSLAARLQGAEPGPLPQWVDPQLAALAEAAPAGEAWLHEIKFDGYRLLARIAEGKARLLTRGRHDWTERFPSVAAALAQLPCREALMDGEVVVLQASGVTDFGALQEALSGGGGDFTFYAFDLLHLDGIGLRGAAVEDRKRLLARLLDGAPPVLRFSDHVVGRGSEVLRQACALAAEGIVSKRLGQPYRSGRGRDWLKSKCTARQEFVIGGFTPPAGRRRGIGALLLGVWEKDRLRYAGKVGTGFRERMLDDLYGRLSPLTRPAAAFADPPGGTAVWVEPSLVAEVEFTEWTRDGHLRHPVFRGLRGDKDASAVVRETPAGPGAGGGEAAMESDMDRRLQSFTITHPDRVLWPGQGLTKRGLAEYYAQVAELMLPHVAGRPLSLVRCPQGEGKDCFFQRHAGAGMDPHVRTVPVPGDEATLWIEDADGLFALVQMGVLEIHQWGCRVDDIERPDRLCFDLDPDPALPWERVIEAAREVRHRLGELELASFVKTTGGKGLHLVVPLQRQDDWPSVKAFCKVLADRLARERPDRYVATITKARRTGKIFIDYLRNQRAASFIAPFSTRARPGAPVSIPLAWEELEAGIRSDHYSVANIGRRLAVLDRDPWQGMAELRQVITPRARKALGL